MNRHVVVIGHGMVGSRFVEDLLNRAPDTHVTVLGEEGYEPYNRVLLSEVVAGKVDVASIALGHVAPGGAHVRPGTTALAVDTGARTVRTSDGDDVPYDALVLATGARARIPEVPGLMPPPAGVHALRTLDDAREIVAATVNQTRAVVVGGGVLGLEAACGLARRGLDVTVVHVGPHVMDRQLGDEAADAVIHGLTRLGIAHRTGTTCTEVLHEPGPDGGVAHVRGVRLADGEELPAGLVVLTAGTVPETTLASHAGIATDRGVLVDAHGRTSDPHVHAIGDCAQPPEGATGLIAQGWEQARRLADRLAGTAVPVAEVATLPAPPTDVVRVKAHGLTVVTMGETRPSVPRTGCRTVRLSDPEGGRLVEVVVDGEHVVAATCVGAPEVAADLTTTYTRRTPAPRDPAQLLLRRMVGAGAGPEPSPTLMPDRATVCRCNGVTKGDIVQSWRTGARCTEDVARATRATTGCGGCTDAVCGLVDWLTRSDPGPAAVQDRAPDPAHA
ncbi:FAD-dependent oxidoreductase [Cellulomonas bogoriensis]|uniref:Electron transfer flavoprotein n=1 Tax=Cellulomonas bogoriensis 69B4 = DSM 16987 TaxID=1386082 RepID=A0A0A0C3U3_9CELL|nr:FAD-dependent oxidoreductase [Cellulomonas bogoriensis]KGM14054.1 electron transfer flavoprotein [Cellulomonas bogoriensis 69B4 = DSM 16987]